MPDEVETTERGDIRPARHFVRKVVQCGLTGERLWRLDKVGNKAGAPEIVGQGPEVIRGSPERRDHHDIANL